MDKQKVLVTGGAGYIGSHACKALQQAGFIPVTFDNLVTGWRDAVKFGPLEVGDLLNKGDLDRVFEKHSPVAIMHFAALSQVGESMQKPGLYWQNNVMGSLNLVQAAVDHGCMDFVFSSTCATYGNQDGVVLDEDSMQHPINAYGASKRAVENILGDFQATYGLNQVIFRYFNVAGADPEAEIGEFHRPETHLIPLILQTATGERKHITIYGTDYETRDGTCVRDYIHINDIARAHLLAADYLADGGQSDFFNLGTETGNTVREVIQACERITGKPIAVVEGERRPGDPPALVASAKKARDVLGWIPQYQNLDDIITTAWQWEQRKTSVLTPVAN